MMRSGQVLGHADCPYCSDKHAEVKLDKHMAPYIVCFECGGARKKTAQHFTHGEPKLIKALLGGGKFRALAGVELPDCLKAAPEVKGGVLETEPAPVPKESGHTLLGRR